MIRSHLEEARDLSLQIDTREVEPQLLGAWTYCRGRRLLERCIIALYISSSDDVPHLTPHSHLTPSLARIMVRSVSGPTQVTEMSNVPLLEGWPAC